MLVRLIFITEIITKGASYNRKRSVSQRAT